MHPPRESNPFQVILALFLVLGGIPIMLGGATPGSVSDELPEAWVHLWGGLLVVAGALVAAGHGLHRLTVERAGLIPLMYGSAVYAIALVASNPRTGWLAFAAQAGIALGALSRAGQVARRLGEREPWPVRLARAVPRRIRARRSRP
jgi:hypothetical protein